MPHFRRALLVALLAIPHLPAAASDVLLVGNKSDDTLWALDLATGQCRSSAPTGSGPHEIALWHNRGTAVVSNYGAARDGRSLSVYPPPESAPATRVDLGDGTRPHGLAFLSPTRVAATAEGTGELLVVDLARASVVQRIPVGAGTPHMVVAADVGATAWVSNIAAGTVSKVDVESGAVLGVVETGAGAEGLALGRDGREIWVANRAADTVGIVDALTLELLATLPARGFPIRVAMSPDGGHALVTRARAGALAVFDVTTRRRIAEVDLAIPDAEYRETLLGRALLPVGVLFHPDGTRAFVALSGADRIAVLDTTSWAVIGHWRTGREPDAMGILLDAPQNGGLDGSCEGSVASPSGVPAGPRDGTAR